ncbi:MAG: terminase TerL endonuclease subunit [Terricaulis sp.]
MDTVLKVFGLLRHTQGEWAGRPLRPDPWQVAYIIAPIFGWVKLNSKGEWARIIRKAYVDVPRKNGKTTLAGGLAVHLTAADNEPGAQVLAAAAGERQARFCFDPVKAIAEKSPALSPHVKTLAKRIIHKKSGSYFEVVSKVAELLHGANIHGAIVDELHVHKSPDLLEAIETGTGSRRQPLVVIITTADDGRQATVYAARRKRIEQLAAGTIEDPAQYGVVWAAAESDDPFAEDTWRGANPGYGISPTREFMEVASREAQQSPADLAKFLRLHLGIRTKQDTRYLLLDEWDRNRGRVDETELAGLTCYGALDLASTSDLCSLAWDFPDGQGGHRVLWRHWLPSEQLHEFDKRTAGMGTVWVREGWLTLTPGNVTDYDWIRAAVAKDRERFKVVELGYDPWNATQLVNDLGADGVELVQVRQGFITMSPPTKELKRLVMEGTEERPRYQHGGNPLVRWQVDNLGVDMDPAGNVKPSKARSAEKIDGLVAGIMALDRASRHQPKKRSAYEDRGITVA